MRSDGVSQNSSEGVASAKLNGRRPDAVGIGTGLDPVVEGAAVGFGVVADVAPCPRPR